MQLTHIAFSVDTQVDEQVFIEETAGLIRAAINVLLKKRPSYSCCARFVIRSTQR
jgi:hypothetical protein